MTANSDASLKNFAFISQFGPDYMANFIPGWNFSPANRADISARHLEQIIWKPNSRLHEVDSARGAIQ